MKLDRRLFLRGLGGAAVAAPFLSSVAERAAKAQGTPAPPTPKRLIVMFTHHGCMTDRWFPMNSHGELLAADYEDTSLKALAPHAGKLLVPRGIRAMNEWNATEIRGQGNDEDLQVVGSYFTCVPVSPHTSDPFNFDSATKFNAMPTAPSLDHVCAKQLTPGQDPLLLRVSGTADSNSTRFSYSAGLEPFAGVGSLLAALNRLTGLFQEGAPVSPDSYKAARGHSVLDIVADDLASLERQDMSQSDKQKLAAWKELLVQTTAAAKPLYSCDDVESTMLNLTADNARAVDDSMAGDITEKITDTLDSADLFSNLAVLSALCDIDRVIFLKYPANYIYRGLGMTIENHGMANRTGSAIKDGPCLADVSNMIATVDEYNARKFAHLVGQLDSFDEGEQRLLDNCAAVWFQEQSDGAAGNLNNMPIIQAGGCGGYFKTGQAVNVDDLSSDLHRGNSEAACAAEDGQVDPAISGTPVEFANAPINKYYCNLMNAIGVKADATGFPTVGGTQEVTHYGMYDDTVDFASGGETPANIKDPGEFAELKANS